jgi:hypothetical protein
MVIDWIQLTSNAVKGLWVGFIDFIPKVIGAIIVFLIGWLIAVVIGRIIAEILRRIKFNRIFENGSWKRALEKAEIKVDVSSFIGAIFKWVLVIVFLLAAVEILGLVQFASFLQNVLNYLPNVIVASAIFVAAVIIADILEKIVRAAVESARIGYGHIVGVIVRWSIWIFAILAILVQLKVTPSLIQIILQGVIGLVVIAGGLAFGLGGKEVAAEILQNLRRKFKEE